MQEKASRTRLQAQVVHPDNYQANMPNPRLSPSRKFLIGLLSLVLPFYIVISLLSDNLSARPQATRLSQSPALFESNRSLVPLEAHIMSKCPDARDCLRDLVVPAMEQVVDKVNFTLSFIGSYVDFPVITNHECLLQRYLLTGSFPDVGLTQTNRYTVNMDQANA